MLTISTKPAKIVLLAEISSRPHHLHVLTSMIRFGEATISHIVIPVERG